MYSRTRQLSFQPNAFLAENSQCHQDLSNQLIGIGSLSLGAVTHPGPASNDITASDESPPTEPYTPTAAESSTLTRYHEGSLAPNVGIQVLRRRPCHPGCHCSCHRAQRLISPGILQKLFGNTPGFHPHSSVATDSSAAAIRLCIRN